GEVAVCAVVPGVGIDLARQPHRIAVRPPLFVLQTTGPAVIPGLGTPLVPPLPTPAPVASRPALGPELFRRFGQQDHRLLVEQWDVLQRLTGAIERYVEARIAERFRVNR